MNHEFKSIQIEQLDDEGKGTAVIATLGVVDKDGDITDPGAFGAQDVIVLPTHDWSSVPLGKGVTREEGGKAFVDFKINLNTRAGKDWHSALKFDLENGKSKQEWSYGFTVKDSSEDTIDGMPVRRLKSLEVHEVSPVVLGAGEGTGTVAIKSMKFKDQIDMVIEELQKVTERAADIKAKREEDGRDISDDRVDQLKTLFEKLEKLHEISEKLKELIAEDEPEMVNPEQIANLHAKFIQTSRELGLDTNN